MHSLATFTTAHTRTDTRIRIKQTASLAAEMGDRVALFVQDGQGGEKDTTTGVEIVDTGPRLSSRTLRMTLGACRMWWAVRRARPRVVHFHDPELIPVGLLLKLRGMKVVYDVHEDVPRQILAKHWITPRLRRPVAALVEGIEWIAGQVFDGIVTATPTITARFPSKKTVTVQNFPMLDELMPPESQPFSERPPHVAYIGGITEIRGAKEMVRALEYVANEEVRLQLGGNFMPKGLEDEVKRLPGWSRVVAHGWVDRGTVANLLGGVRGALVLFHPVPNHINAQPNKLFEYMAAGLPVVASNFPLWREIVEGNHCGICVDPLDPKAIAEAIEFLVTHPEEARKMGENGRRAVVTKYNWDSEAEKLLSLYRELLR